jgi:UDPglucose 6-dehydrogenase
MKITIIGTGFVGVVSAAVYASLGHEVMGLDIDENKVQSLKRGRVPFYEPNLEELLTEQQKKRRLTFTTDYQEAIKSADLAIVAVGTPSKKSGAVDLKYVYKACESLAPHLKNEAIVAIKSTVPPGSFEQIKKIIQTQTRVKFYLASLPEFLKEGTAVQDTLKPDRIVIGAANKKIIQQLAKLHKPFKAPIVTMSAESAQMTKYAANAYLATRITFINQIANLCEHNGADIQDVIKGIGYDTRIGHHYWYPGLGYGGSCFPKDVAELADYAKRVNEDRNLMINIHQLNQERIPDLMSKYEQDVNSWLNKQVALLGLSFKPYTNDTREAPAQKIAEILLKAGATVRSFDPKASWNPDNNYQGSYQQVKTMDQACQDADVIFVLIEWPQIIEYDFAQCKTDKKQYIFDTRNQLNPEKLKQAGFIYRGIAHK